jgi:hypothetical protein
MTTDDIGAAMPDQAAVENSALPTASALRMRLHRARRQNGLRCLTVELREREIEALVAKRLLSPGSRGDRAAIRKALYAYLDGTLGRPV